MNIKSVQNSVTVLLSDTSSMHKIFNALSDYTYTFYKQLGSGLSPQGCWYFQVFWGKKLLNVCIVVWPSNLCLRGIQ